MNIKSSIFHTIWMLCLLLVFCLPGCGTKDHNQSVEKKPKETIIEAALQSNTTHLFFNGDIQPLDIVSVKSPAEGFVEKMFFRQGDQVAAGQVLAKISSSKSQQEYANALTNFIRDKDQYVQNKNRFEGTAVLYKEGIIGREEYQSQESQLGTSRLAYINSTNALRAVAEKTPNAPKNIENLTLKDVNRIEEMLQKQKGEFDIKSPVAGVALSPKKSGGNEESGGEIPTEGSEVKQNQTITDIGDLTGIKVVIQVHEIDINKIHTKEKVLLTGPALPGIIFYGHVETIGRQTKSREGGQGSATFPVSIIVPEITSLQRELVRIGMTVKADIEIKNPPQIKIPLKAVSLVNGKPTVLIVDSKTGQPKEITVETGTTELDSVIILKGIKVGDKVIVRD